LSFEDLRTLDAGQKEKVPLLEECLDLLLAKDMEVQIEVKDGKTISPLIELVRNLSLKDQNLLTVISFHHGWLKEFKANLPRVSTALLLYGRPLNAPEIAKACSANGISFNIGFIDEELRQQTKEAGLSLTGWNANTKKDFLKMEALNLDYLGTDVPSNAISWHSD
ncbi:MAG: glycerophosphodiester phosphodiesterase, partial [Halobacteriovoraceae bacterium]|nr:glycerophosphodiester phosphodiesterase [Halobacteriovoraceae bacterium]